MAACVAGAGRAVVAPREAHPASVCPRQPSIATGSNWWRSGATITSWQTGRLPDGTLDRLGRLLAHQGQAGVGPIGAGAARMTSMRLSRRRWLSLSLVGLVAPGAV